MKLMTGTIVALILASGLVLDAQRPARTCGIYIQIKGGKLQTASYPKTECEFGGQFSVLIHNLDANAYSVVLEKFRFDDALAGAPACKPSNPVGTSPIGGRPSQHIFSVAPYDVSASKVKKIKAKKYLTECYKFDVALYLDGDQVDFKDPDLEITEPPPPPVIGPQKPPPPEF